MKKTLVILAALLLSGCVTSGTHSPIIKTFDAKTVEITWLRSNAGCGGTALACSSFKVGGENKCIIRVPEPSGWEDSGMIETLGHEVLHCFYGEGHAEERVWEYAR